MKEGDVICWQYNYPHFGTVFYPKQHGISSYYGDFFIPIALWRIKTIKK